MGATVPKHTRPGHSGGLPDAILTLQSGRLDTSAKALAPDSIQAFVERSADAWDAVPDPLIAFDAQSEIVFANSAAKRFLMEHCLPLDRALIQTNIEICDSETGQAPAFADLPLARALRGELTDHRQYRVRPLPHGTPFRVESSARPLYSHEGQVHGAVIVFQEVRPSKREPESGKPMRDFIVQGNLAGVAHTTVDGRILDCNEALVRMLGFSSVDELRATPVPQLYCEPSQRDELIRGAILTNSVHEAELCLRRRDASQCWALVNVRRLDAAEEHGETTLVTTVIDITDRKQWEETLRQSEARFTAFMRHLPGIAFLKDLTGRYVYYNEAAWHQFGRRPRDILGKTDEEIWSPAEAARHREYDHSVITSGRMVQFVEPATQADGVHYWLIHKFPITEDGKVILVGGIGIDITERRTLEEQLTQARKMEALGRLAGGVAHDFNNLLTVIAGYGQLALESLNASPERLAGYVQEIINSAKRAAGMTSQLLAFSRRNTAEPRVIDLAEVMRHIEPLLRRMIGEHVELKMSCRGGPCRVRADVHQLEQVLMNLAVNARDAMPLGGLLEIECSLLDPPFERPGLHPLHVLLEVRDNGIGMDDATQARMFEPFFTSKEQGKGTGLGLSTVYGVVSQAGGDIKVESEQGVGTSFRIYFPLVTEGQTESLFMPGDTAPVGLETVLLVEDEPGVRALAEVVLRRLGYTVLVAENGTAALRLWEESRGSIDVLLTDVIMPRMSGSELAGRLREMNPGLKILFMSGYTDDMLSDQGILAGETQLIQKPFTAEALARKLRSVLDA